MEAYVGQIRLFAGDYAPDGWALCNGATLNIAGNEILFALISNIYGGNGKTNFQLPDLRGRLPLHIGKGPQTTTNYTIGQTAGAETVTVTTANFPAHNHIVNATKASATQTSPQGNPLLGKPALGFYMPENSAVFVKSPMNDAALGTAPGGGESHDNSMPTIAMNYIICTVGLYPNFQ
jgi:microcystin-dependent protein